jgi:ankyrin repeat protein
MARGAIHDPWYTTSEVIEWFLDHGASIRGKDITKSMFSLRPSAVLMRKLLELSSTAAISPEALAYAASRGYTDVVKQLLDTGLPGDATPPPLTEMDLVRDGPHKTALFHAVTGNNGDLNISDSHLETAKLLLDNGAKVDTTCGYNLETPFSAALTLKKNQRAMRKLLLSFPNNIDKPSPTSSQRKTRRL